MLNEKTISKYSNQASSVSKDNSKDSNSYDREGFYSRHVGPRPRDVASMLSVLGVKSLEELVAKTVPDEIILEKPLELEEPLSEAKLIERLREIASKNSDIRALLGLGYYGTLTPAVIKRNILENPGWYTQYTPYQAEISQGRLEALLNFQTMICDLTAMELANSSLLDEGTAVAEAVMMLHRASKTEKKTIVISANAHPQTISVLETRAKPLGLEVLVCKEDEFLSQKDVFLSLIHI